MPAGSDELVLSHLRLAAEIVLEQIRDTVKVDASSACVSVNVPVRIDDREYTIRLTAQERK